MASYKKLEDVIPGIHLAKFARSRFLYARVYDKATQTYMNRSTGLETLPEARQWVMENLKELFQAKPTTRGGGSNSVSRLLAQHQEFLAKRSEAGEISQSTLLAYEKASRHFIRWFASRGIKKLSDIERNTLAHYGRSRVTDDGMSPNTVNLEVVYIRMWWKYLNNEEIVSRTLRIDSVQKAIENRTGGEPFAPGDLKAIHKAIEDWKKDKSKENFGKMSVSKYNKELFSLFIQLLSESGCRQHELWNRTWKDIQIGETLTNRKRMINIVSIPQKAKRGSRQSVFRGDALVKIKELQKKMCPEVTPSDYVFRSHQTNTLIDISTFSRYWSVIKVKTATDYKLHTFRAYRITQLVLSGVEPQLVARNLGLSLKQLESTYLRFVPAGHFDKLVQGDLKTDVELRMIMTAE